MSYDHLRWLAQAATPGPWHQVDAMVVSEPGADYDICDCALGAEGADEWESAVNDARYVAAMSPDVVLSLLDALDAVRAEVDEYRTQVSHLVARTPTLMEMERCLGSGDRDEIPQGEPYPAGWPTVRRCVHCRTPVPGGPTVCKPCAASEDVMTLAYEALACVSRAEFHGCVTREIKREAERIEAALRQVGREGE